MTTIGKLLVFANLFVAVALLAWAVSLSANRLDWVDRTTADGTKIEGEISLLKKDIERSVKAITDANVGYSQAKKELKDQESGRTIRKSVLDERLSKAKRGEFRDQLLLGDDPNSSTGPELKARIDVQREGKAIVDLNGNPLRGVDAIQADLSREVRLSSDLSAAIAKARKEFAEVSVEIADTDTKIGVQRGVLSAIADEAKFLDSLQINWDEELRTLSRRKGQLEKRLKTLGVEPAAAIPPRREL
ncbi:MAG: hypothetical protein ACRC7O_07075 [Fimbriiglobus sp.]